MVVISYVLLLCRVVSWLWLCCGCVVVVLLLCGGCVVVVVCYVLSWSCGGCGCGCGRVVLSCDVCFTMFDVV